MSFTTFFGPTSVVSEQALWIADGSRRICITYEYNANSGILRYAATVFKCEPCEYCDGYIEPTEQQLRDNAHTTERRYSIRPVIVNIPTFLNYGEILKAIRREMCHGFGCKGPRTMKLGFGLDCDVSDNESNSDSNNSFLSDVASELSDPDYIPEEEVDVGKLESKKLRKVRYISHGTVENFQGEKTRVVREYFIVFKANKRTGDLIYGAAISRRPETLGPLEDNALVDDHYETAISRLNKKPVPMRISEDYRHELCKGAIHREDVMYEILDVINSRPGGKFLIGGTL